MRDGPCLPALDAPVNQPPMRIVVTGANRGIGLELCRQYLERGDTVDAAVRRPEEAQALRALGDGRKNGTLRIHACDVTDDASVRRFAEALPPGPLDLLINNAGVMGKTARLEELDLADAVHTYDVNALGPIRVTRALLPRLQKGARVVHVTSKMGSLTDNTSGGAYGYRMSKAALNMACRSMAIDHASDGITFIVVNPGWVQTDMGGSHATTPVNEAAGRLVALFDRLRPKDSGHFFNHTGEEVPW